MDALIAAYNLQPHPEGGWYAETYRSPLTITLPGGTVRSMTVAELDEETKMVKETVLGHNLDKGERLQHVVKGGTWFGCWGNAGDGSTTECFSLVGCTVAPGFDFSDFELASRAALLASWGSSEESRDVIMRLTEGLP